MFGWTGTLTPAQAAEIAAVKRVIYKGFKAALLAGASKQKGGNSTTPAAVLEEILPDLDQMLVMTEKSGFRTPTSLNRHCQKFDASRN